MRRVSSISSYYVPSSVHKSIKLDIIIELTETKYCNPRCAVIIKMSFSCDAPSLVVVPTPINGAHEIINTLSYDHQVRSALVTTSHRQNIQRPTPLPSLALSRSIAGALHISFLCFGSKRRRNQRVNQSCRSKWTSRRTIKLEKDRTSLRSIVLIMRRVCVLQDCARRVKYHLREKYFKICPNLKPIRETYHHRRCFLQQRL